MDMKQSTLNTGHSAEITERKRIYIIIYIHAVHNYYIYIYMYTYIIYTDIHVIIVLLEHLQNEDTCIYMYAL